MKRLNEFKRRKGAEQDPDELESDDAGEGVNDGGGGGGAAGGTANKSDRVQAGGAEHGDTANAAGGATAGVGGGRIPQVHTSPMPVFGRGVFVRTKV